MLAYVPAHGIPTENLGLTEQKSQYSYENTRLTVLLIGLLYDSYS